MNLLLILVGFLEKWTKSSNLGNFRVLRRGVGIPHSNVSQRHGAADKEA